MTQVSEGIKADMAFNVLPADSESRIYGGLDFMAIQISFGIAAWFFLVGSLTGLAVKASEALPIILFGNCFPLLLIAPMAVIFARYGVEQWQGSAAVLGHRFKDIWLIVYISSSYGWIAYASFLFGESAIKFVKFFNGPAFLSTEVPGAIIFAFCATAIGAYIAYLGPKVLKWFTRIAAIFLLAVLAYFIWSVFTKYGAAHIFAAEPKEPLATLAWSRASAIEWNVGLGLSWAFWYGQWTRLAKSEKAAFHGCLWGWGLLACTAGVFSAFVALVLKTYDPSEWIVSLGSPSVAVIGLLLFAIANIGSVTCLVYPMSITTRSRFPKLNWPLTVVLCSAPALILENPTVFTGYGVYLAYIALLTGTYGGIMMADYFIVGRRKWSWSLRAIYNTRSTYSYWYGFNPAALISTIVAALFYLWTLEPLSWTSPNGLFPYITAGIPSFFIAFIVYAVLMKVWIMKNMMPPIESVKSSQEG